ncbi:MAG: HAMP domain-containing sensor histidine kinase [Candidatus Limnocylindrales bacterium]
MDGRTPDRRDGAHDPSAALLARTRRRLLLWTAASTMAALVLLGGALYATAAIMLQNTSVDQLRARADVIGNVVVSDLAPPPGSFFQAPVAVGGASEFGIALGGPASGTIAVLVAADGTILPPGIPAAFTDAEGIALARQGGVVIRSTTIEGAPVRTVSRSVLLGGQPFVVQVFGDRSTEQRTLDVLLTILVGGGVVVLAASLLLGRIYADRALVPVREAMRRQREFAAEASHELRTPLTVMRSSLELLRRHPEQRVAEAGDALDDLEAETDHMTTLVEDLLLLARTDSGVVELELTPTDLADVVLDAVPSMGASAASRRTRLEVDAEPAPIRGDVARLRQLVTILVDNAIRHGRPDGGQVSIRVRGGAEATLVVEDDGPGIAPDELDHVFDRFWRSPDAPDGGTGLGLSIARWIAERHGGSITAALRVPHGASFTVHLPSGGPTG